ncbi:uncharacterized protein Gasu_64450 [Galdieria sulphuraria]|uniref:SAGA-associated factor 11 n=1 Tax=Galdieria sulphuraria TaxID=130081 RepID=M2WQ52_GALSU|nr:uncharacterized protein Gasu_64450 [Galdieria sulphuraria]EME25895.1 hypothetical protein Gasu_64450 [Galdieria sulphuraria]|eukprot:XP_005702415.1 hypothetical protein Gasu_64450 [Galdieria sulphuraria]
MPPRRRKAATSAQRKTSKANSRENRQLAKENDSNSRGQLSRELSSTRRTFEEMKEVETMETFDHIPAPPLKRKNKSSSQEKVENDHVVEVDKQKESELERRKRAVESILRDTAPINFSSATFLAARVTEKLVRRIYLEGLLKFRFGQEKVADELKRHIFDVSFDKGTLSNQTNPKFSLEQTGKQLSQSFVRNSTSSYNNTRNLSCSHCGSLVASSRYAAHLEKCLGKGGRLSSRAASLRLRNAASDFDQNMTEDNL